MLGQKVRGWGACLAAVGALSLGAARASAIEVGDVMTDLQLPSYQSQIGALTGASLAGKVTVLNFWATWCAACKVELVEMETRFAPLMAQPGFQMAFVSLDKDPAKAAEWFQGNLKKPEDLLKHLFLDSKFETADRLKVDSFPMTVIIGKDGKVAHVQRGFKEGEDSTAALVAMASKLAGAAASPQ